VKEVKVNKRITVAKYLEQQIAMSEKSQKEIAEACGYDKPNIITMLKQGSTKLPINKVGPMAKALGVDPKHLLSLVLQEYMPETWESLQSIVGESLVSADELRLMKKIRKITAGIEIDPDADDVVRVLEKLGPIAEKEEREREKSASSVRRRAA
jgi:transcriptional regulator with XRE-family HTH domain